MNKHLSRIIVIVLLVGIAAFFYHRRLGESPPHTATPATASAPQAEASKAHAPPPVRYPLNVPPRASIRTPASSSASAPAAAPALPTLDHSDAAMSEVLGLLVGQPTLDTLFRTKSFVRHVVVIVDNLPRTQLPQRDMPTQPVAGQFLVTGPDDHPHISPANYARYAPYIHLLEVVNLKDLVTAYVHYYPLFQQAYVELGYPKRYFNDRLIAAIDNLLATPEVKQPVPLVRPNVVYKFADPALEALSAGQKILIRMGPDNAARVKLRLTALRKALLAQVSKTAQRMGKGQ